MTNVGQPWYPYDRTLNPQVSGSNPEGRTKSLVTVGFLVASPFRFQTRARADANCQSADPMLSQWLEGQLVVPVSPQSACRDLSSCGDIGVPFARLTIRREPLGRVGKLPRCPPQSLRSAEGHGNATSPVPTSL
jgi:hypothetical protein